MYLANIVFGEVYCQLNCEYCMYTKSIQKKFNDAELSKISSNIDKIKKFIDKYAKKLQVISLTGGEPTMFPDIIKKFYDKFNDKIIRISTNGLLLDKIDLDNFSNERMFFAVTLDGIDLEDNGLRFKSQSALNKIISNIDLLLGKGFNVEVLTVLSPKNMLKYIKLIDYFEDNYKDFIKSGKLWFIPIELVNYMGINKFEIDDELKNGLTFNIKENMSNSIVFSMYKEYFDQLISYYSGISVPTCGMYKWGLHFKYLKDSIWTTGNFSLYGCGSRGHLMMGVMNFDNEYDESFIMERRQTNSVNKYFLSSENACRKCFDNRHFYGLFLERKMSNIPYILRNSVLLYNS